MITVIGLGFVGLTTALGFAHKGYKTYGFDIDQDRIRKIEGGVIPFHEPFLDKFLVKYKNKRFFSCNSLEEAISNAKIIFYCVGTPSKDDGSANLKLLKKAIKESLKFMKKKSYKVLVVKSTVPPSTTQSVIRPLISKSGFKVGKNIGLANNPEFLREGLAWEDFINPDRIVIGENDSRSGAAIEKIYKSFDVPLFRVSLNTAEFIKYLSNTLLSTLISFSNEMSIIADLVGDIDIASSFKILHRDRRWSGSPASMTSYAYPGCGFGGYCLPKDTAALCKIAKSKGYGPGLIQEVLSINNKIKKHIVEKIAKSVQKKSYIGILGLSFKPGSDDVRYTPAKDIIEMLVKKGFKRIIAYDPLATNNFKKTYDLPITYADNIKKVIKKSSVIVLLTAWEEFKKKKTLLKGKKIIDGRYFLCGGN